MNRTARRRARVFGVAVEPVDVVAVLDRDGWTCQICLGPIDPAARWQPVERGRRPELASDRGDRHCAC